MIDVGISTKTADAKRRFLRGLGSTALGPVITAIIQLGSVPLLLHSWGAAKYGDWLMLSAIPSYLTFADLGFGNASGSDMTVRVARGDSEGALVTFQSSWALLLLISATVLLASSLVVWWIPWQHWMHLSSLSDGRAAGVILVLGAYVVVGQQWGVLESGYRCDGNFATGTFCGMMLRLLEMVFATLSGVTTGSLVDSAITLLLVRSLGVLAYAILLRLKSPWLSLGLRHARGDRVRELAAPACGFIAMPLGNAISIQGFTILIGLVSGPIAVTMFATMRTLARLNFQITNVISVALWPELSSAFGSGNIGLARTLHRRAYQASLALSFAGGLLLWFVGPMIYRGWIRHAVGFDATCFHILLLVTLANSLWFTSSVVPMSTNAHQRVAIAYVVASALALAAGWGLVHSMGISGAAWSLLLIDASMVTLVLHTSLQQLDETLVEFISAIFRLPSRRQIAGLVGEA